MNGITNISVIIPMYNSSKTIEKTLKSIINQSMFELVREIIVVDDGSKDNSVEVVEKLQELSQKIVLLKKENGGAASARNYGMSYANGDWIAFCDSDDEWIEDKLKIQNDIIKNNPQIDFLGGGWMDRNPRVFFKKIDKLYHASLADICITFFPQPSTVVMKKKIYSDIGGFRDDQRYAEEGDFFYRICGKYQYWYTPERLIIFGNGKAGFGVSGLSANLKGMYKGNVENIQRLMQRRSISIPFYLFLRIFYWIKYMRRVLITHIKRNNFNW